LGTNLDIRIALYNAAGPLRAEFERSRKVMESWGCDFSDVGEMPDTVSDASAPHEHRPAELLFGVGLSIPAITDPARRKVALKQFGPYTAGPIEAGGWGTFALVPRSLPGAGSAPDGWKVMYTLGPKHSSHFEWLGLEWRIVTDVLDPMLRSGDCSFFQFNYDVVDAPAITEFPPRDFGLASLGAAGFVPRAMLTPPIVKALRWLETNPKGVDDNGPLGTAAARKIAKLVDWHADGSVRFWTMTSESLRGIVDRLHPEFYDAV
jgi:hypothetical protein